MGGWQGGVLVMFRCSLLCVVAVLLCAGCAALEPAPGKPATAVLPPQVEAVLVQVEHAYATLETLDARNQAVMRISGQTQRMNQTLRWDTSEKTMRWERSPLIIEIARTGVSVIRQGNVTHRIAVGNWADTIAAVTGSASAVPVEVKLLCGADRAAWLDAVTAGTIGTVTAESVETTKDADGHAQHHVQLVGLVGSGTLVIDAALGLFAVVETQSHATLPSGQVIKASARITFERGK